MLSSIVKLRELNLSDNFLVGSIPAELGNLTKLQVLQLDDNQFSEDIVVAGISSRVDQDSVVAIGGVTTRNSDVSDSNILSLNTVGEVTAETSVVAIGGIAAEKQFSMLDRVWTTEFRLFSMQKRLTATG